MYYIVLFVSIDILHASNQTTTKLRINLRKFNKHCNEQFYIMLSLITLGFEKRAIEKSGTFIYLESILCVVIPFDIW